MVQSISTLAARISSSLKQLLTPDIPGHTRSQIREVGPPTPGLSWENVFRSRADPIVANDEPDRYEAMTW
jgi:hypothetical protein